MAPPERVYHNRAWCPAHAPSSTSGPLAPPPPVIDKPPNADAIKARHMAQMFAQRRDEVSRIPPEQRQRREARERANSPTGPVPAMSLYSHRFEPGPAPQSTGKSDSESHAYV
jgi:hypothetical protein